MFHKTRRGVRIDLILAGCAQVAIIVLLSGTSPAQIGAGALFQSLDNLQVPGLSSISLPGDPSVTRTEIIAWSFGDGPGGGRVLMNFLGMTTMIGDQDGDGLPIDISDIDALEVGPYNAGESPNIFDFRFSLANPIFNGFGIPIATPGDIIQVTGVNSWTKVISENAFKAALGTGQSLDVDAYCELANGDVMVSFRGIGSGVNIVNPLFGSVGIYNWSGADIFIIRQPFGLLPALLAYREAELDGIVSAYYQTYNLSEIVGVEEQPFTVPGNNPWDPANIFQGGTRPQILWTVEGDEEVFCGVWTANPLGPTNFFSLVSGGQGAGFTTNVPGNLVAMDALAWAPNPLPANSRVTLDANAFNIFNGGSLTLTVRSPAAAGTQFQIVIASQLGFGQGLTLPGFGFEAMVLNVFDPLLHLTLTQPVASVLTTAPAGTNGNASTIAFPIPLTFTSMNLYFQAFQLPTGTLSPPLTVHFN